MIKMTTNEQIQKLMSDEMLDGDGYPTQSACDIIALWDFTDSTGWFEFIKGIWWMPDWGWRESDVKDECFDKMVRQYNISTGGWSGNEDIIRAMMKNNMLWNFCWVQSRRGGHYIFEDDEHFGVE